MDICVETELHKSNVLDLRAIAIPERCFRIASVFETLAIHGTFVLVSDSDPETHHRHLEAEFQDRIHWEVLEHGPETWRIRITKTS